MWAELLWGPGFDRPDTTSLLEKLIAPVVPTLGLQVLDLSPGLGGAVHRLINNFGFRMTVSEKYTAVDTLDRGGFVLPFDLEKDALPEEHYDCIVLCDGFCSLHNKIDALGRLYAALKPQGHLFLLDYVLGGKRDRSGKLRHWLGSEKKEPWNIRQFQLSLEGVGFSVAVCDDISDRYKALVLKKWSHCLPELKRHAVTRAFKQTVLSEAERWFSVLSILNDGSLRVYQIHAEKV